MRPCRRHGPVPFSSAGPVKRPSDLGQSELSGTPQERDSETIGFELAITSSRVKYDLEMSVCSLGDGRQAVTGSRDVIKCSGVCEIEDEWGRHSQSTHWGSFRDRPIASRFQRECWEKDFDSLELY